MGRFGAVEGWGGWGSRAWGKTRREVVRSSITKGDSVGEVRGEERCIVEGDWRGCTDGAPLCSGCWMGRAGGRCWGFTCGVRYQRVFVRGVTIRQGEAPVV